MICFWAMYLELLLLLLLVLHCCWLLHLLLLGLLWPLRYEASLSLAILWV